MCGIFKVLIFSVHEAVGLTRSSLFLLMTSRGKSSASGKVFLMYLRILKTNIERHVGQLLMRVYILNLELKGL